MENYLSERHLWCWRIRLHIKNSKKNNTLNSLIITKFLQQWFSARCAQQGWERERRGRYTSSLFIPGVVQFIRLYVTLVWTEAMENAAKWRRMNLAYRPISLRVWRTYWKASDVVDCHIEKLPLYKSYSPIYTRSEVWIRHRVTTEMLKGVKFWKVPLSSHTEWVYWEIGQGRTRRFEFHWCSSFRSKEAI